MKRLAGLLCIVPLGALAGEPADRWAAFAESIGSAETVVVGLYEDPWSRSEFVRAGVDVRAALIRADLGGDWVLESTWRDPYRITWTGGTLWVDLASDDIGAVPAETPLAVLAAALIGEVESGFATTTVTEASPAGLVGAAPSWDVDSWVRLDFAVAPLDSVAAFVTMGPAAKPGIIVVVDKSTGEVLIPSTRAVATVQSLEFDWPVGDDLAMTSGHRIGHASLPHTRGRMGPLGSQPWETARSVQFTIDAAASTSDRGRHVVSHTCAAPGETESEPMLLRFRLEPDAIAEVSEALSRCPLVEMESSVRSTYRVDETGAGVCIQGSFRLIHETDGQGTTVIHQQPISGCHTEQQDKERRPGWRKRWIIGNAWPLDELVFELVGNVSINCYAVGDRLALGAVSVYGKTDNPTIDWETCPLIP